MSTPFGQHSQFAVLLQLAAAMLAGGLVGLERSYHGRAAGFRTFSLVALGSCLLMTMAVRPDGWSALQGLPPVVDPTRVVQGIVTGVGFLGAGVIFREGFNVRGLTTAACIWVVSAIGVMIGVGFYPAAAAATLMTLLILSGFRYVERWMPRQYYTTLSIRYERERAPAQALFRRRMAELGFDVVELSYRAAEGRASIEYLATVVTPDEENVAALADWLKAAPEVLGFRLAPNQD